jgi:hypothetical protein
MKPKGHGDAVPDVPAGPVAKGLVVASRPLFQILSLDGGGYRELFSAAVLAAFEEDLGRPVSQ